MTTTIEAVEERAVKLAPDKRTRRKKQPLYKVILLDDDDHTYEYVIGMLRRLFGHTTERAYELASEVDQAGCVVLDTTTLERAELKRDQIHAFGRDWRIRHCRGSMTSCIEPVGK
jgi:ATP-dependent Clp protease adaptor protein ClpS